MTRQALGILPLRLGLLACLLGKFLLFLGYTRLHLGLTRLLVGLLHLLIGLRLAAGQQVCLLCGGIVQFLVSSDQIIRLLRLLLRLLGTPPQFLDALLKFLLALHALLNDAAPLIHRKQKRGGAPPHVQRKRGKHHHINHHNQYGTFHAAPGDGRL